MQLCATLTKADLTTLIEQFTPVRVTLRPGQMVSFGRPSKIDLVPGAGLRVRGDARFTWGVHGLTFPVTVRTWQVLLLPSLIEREGARILAFDPILEVLDFKSVPMFLDARAADAISEALSQQKHKLEWNFARHLSVAGSLPPQITPGGSYALAPTRADVVVTATELRLTLEFTAQVQRDVPLPAPSSSSSSRALGEHTSARSHS